MNTLPHGILVVSFGTSSKQTGISAIEHLESHIRNTFSSYAVYRAWTSKRTRTKLQEQENIKINSISEALEQMKNDGIRSVTIQPTFVIDGEESQRMKQEALVFTDDFLSMEFGAPLLDDDTDAKAAAMAISSEVKALPSYSKEDLVVFMGHGAALDNTSNAMYALVDQYLQQSGNFNMVLRLMNEPDSIDEILAIASSLQPRTIILVPFMIAAGRHAEKDMAGEHETSWASKLTSAGYSVQCIMKGLGEYNAIQEIFSEHIKRVL